MAQPNITMRFEFQQPTSLPIFNRMLKSLGFESGITADDAKEMIKYLNEVVKPTDTYSTDFFLFNQHAIDNNDSSVPFLPSLEDAFTRLRTRMGEVSAEGAFGPKKDQRTPIEKLCILIGSFASAMVALGMHGGNSRQIALWHPEGILILESIFRDDEAQKQYDERIAADRLTEAEKEGREAMGKMMEALLGNLVQGVMDGDETLDAKDGAKFIQELLNGPRKPPTRGGEPREDLKKSA